MWHYSIWDSTQDLCFYLKFKLLEKDKLVPLCYFLTIYHQLAVGK